MTGYSAGTVKLSTKIYLFNEFKTDRADVFMSIERATHVLAWYCALYSKPEAIDTESGATFWFHDSRGYNLRVTLSGVSVAELRRAYRKPSSSRVRANAS